MGVFKPEKKIILELAVKYWIKKRDSALKVYGHINTWDVSLITDMSYLFAIRNEYTNIEFELVYDPSTFNDCISNWDVSNVTDMDHMFNGAKSFNQELNWNVSNVIYMSCMFANAESFNQELNWNVSN